ncbi:MAG TPA: DUF3533 domain-containing protein, partial [Acidimicrobiales bacterium]|nr:DUF3533 domain-containing protein [Acidimicrobiales bacterium]
MSTPKPLASNEGGAPAKADAYPIRALMVLRVPRLWVVTGLLAAVLVGLITVFYISSVVDPIAHLHDLPVIVVNEDAGAMVGAQTINIGRQVQTGLTASHVVSSHLKIMTSDLTVAKQTMDSDDAYATVLIPPNF